MSTMAEMFQPVLFEWINILSDASNAIFALLNSSISLDDYLYKLTYEYFGKLLTTGVAHLANLLESWDGIFAGI